MVNFNTQKWDLYGCTFEKEKITWSVVTCFFELPYVWILRSNPYFCSFSLIVKSDSEIAMGLKYICNCVCLLSPAAGGEFVWKRAMCGNNIMNY